MITVYDLYGESRCPTAGVSGLVGEPANETEKSSSPGLAFFAGPTTSQLLTVLGRTI
jgi:hypothetical protein